MPATPTLLSTATLWWCDRRGCPAKLFTKEGAERHADRTGHAVLFQQQTTMIYERDDDE